MKHHVVPVQPENAFEQRHYPTLCNRLHMFREENISSSSRQRVSLFTLIVRGNSRHAYPRGK